MDASEITAIKDLPLLARVAKLAEIMKERQWTASKTATEMGMSKANVSNCLLLNRLCEEGKARMSESLPKAERLPIGFARDLARRPLDVQFRMLAQYQAEHAPTLQTGGETKMPKGSATRRTSGVEPFHRISKTVAVLEPSAFVRATDDGRTQTRYGGITTDISRELPEDIEVPEKPSDGSPGMDGTYFCQFWSDKDYRWLSGPKEWPELYRLYHNGKLLYQRDPGKTRPGNYPDFEAAKEKMLQAKAV